jgi:hypothetical protein
MVDKVAWRYYEGWDVLLFDNAIQVHSLSSFTSPTLIYYNLV